MKVHKKNFIQETHQNEDLRIEVIKKKKKSNPISKLHLKFSLEEYQRNTRNGRNLQENRTKNGFEGKKENPQKE